jgi:LPS sulfotransferase NodH
MKTFISILCAAIALGGLIGCSTVNSRVHEKAAVFNTLDPNTQSKISHGEIDLGFTPDMVYMALGNPDIRRQAVSTTGQTETWIYRSYYDGYDPEFTGFHHFHRWYTADPYMHHYHMYWGPYYGDAPEEAQDDIRVTFQNGRVIAIDQAKT